MKAIDGLVSVNSPQLIPIFKKPERKLLSILMATLEIVPGFRSEILKLCGYGSGKTCQYQSFMEPHYASPSLPNRYPDGLIVCTRGNSVWSAFIEAKAESNKIRAEQIQEYASMAYALDVDAVISISNEYAASPEELPYHLAGNKRRKRHIYHLSWPEIKTALGLYLGSSTSSNDAELAVLRSVLAFMLSGTSGVETYDAMPPDWAKFVESANTALGFGSNTSGVTDIIHGWKQQRRDFCAKLNGLVGGGVELRHLSGARSERQERDSFDKKLLADRYQLKAGYHFKYSKADLEILSDLKACSHSFALEIRPPNGKKAKATISWLVGKLSDLQFEKYKVAITWPGRGGETLIDLEQLIRFPETIYRGQKDAPRSIMLITGHRDVRRFKSRKRFIEDMEGNAIRLVQEAINRGFLSP